MIPARGKAPVAVAPPPPPPPATPDLIVLLADEEGARAPRAALAVGRVGLGDGVEPLLPLLGDPDPEVRQMAAFALGLIGDRRARDPLVRALSDPLPLVQGGAAEALGLIGDPAAAEPIGRMIAQVVESGALAQPPGEDGDARRDTPAGAFRLGVYALVRLKAYDQLGRRARSGGPAARALVAGRVRAAAARRPARLNAVDHVGLGTQSLHARVHQGLGR